MGMRGKKKKSISQDKRKHVLTEKTSIERMVSGDFWNKDYRPEHGRFNCAGDCIWPTGEITRNEDI